MVTPCSSPGVTDSSGGSSRVGGLHAYGMEIKILWALGAVGTVWAHGWLLLAVLSAGGWDLSAPLMLLRGSGARLGAGLGSICPAQPPCAR